MADLVYLFLAYTVFWLISFGFIYSLTSRQRKLKEDLSLLRQLLDDQSDR